MKKFTERYFDNLHRYTLENMEYYVHDVKRRNCESKILLSTYLNTVHDSCDFFKGVANVS